jgi:hypothetical protein
MTANEAINQLLTEQKLSFSALNAFATSPRALLQYKMAAFEPSEAMVVGQMVHTYTLEPNEVKSRYLILPDVNGATKEGKQALYNLYCHYVEQVPEDGFKMKIDDIKASILSSTGLQPVSAKMVEAAKYMSDAIKENSQSSIFLTYGVPELAFATFIEGVQFSGRVDLLNKPGNYIADIKTMADASRNAAARDIIKKRYHWQAAIYMQAFDVEDFYFLCVDGKGEVSVHSISEALRQQAMSEIKSYVQRFKECLQEPELFTQSQEFYCGVNVLDVYVK